MSGETEDQVSGWTVDTLRAHVLSLLDERDRRYEQRFADAATATSAALAAAEKAVTKAETATERRFEGVNEFRGQLADQARDLMPRKETETIIEGMRARLTVLERKGDSETARTGGISDYRGYLVGVAGFLVGIAGLVLVAMR